jgi:REP element-mobilizing transposase RayT
LIEHHRQSIRLRGYDYRQQGLYFITICTQHRLPLFGKVVDGIMQHNDAGNMINVQWHEMARKFPNIVLHEFITMPNHIHGIIEIMNDSVGANLCVRPNLNGVRPVVDNVCSDLNGIRPVENGDCHDSTADDIKGAHADAPLHQMIQWVKTMTTNAYIRGVKSSNWQPFDGKLWQRNYYEHIIRDQQAYDHISQYIANNPITWQDDTYFDES